MNDLLNSCKDVVLADRLRDIVAIMDPLLVDEWIKNKHVLVRACNTLNLSNVKTIPPSVAVHVYNHIVECVNLMATKFIVPMIGDAIEKKSTTDVALYRLMRKVYGSNNPNEEMVRMDIVKVFLVLSLSVIVPNRPQCYQDMVMPNTSKRKFVSKLTWDGRGRYRMLVYNDKQGKRRSLPSGFDMGDSLSTYMDFYLKYFRRAVDSDLVFCTMRGARWTRLNTQYMHILNNWIGIPRSVMKTYYDIRTVAMYPKVISINFHLPSLNQIGVLTRHTHKTITQHYTPLRRTYFNMQEPVPAIQTLADCPLPAQSMGPDECQLVRPSIVQQANPESIDILSLPTRPRRGKYYLYVGVVATSTLVSVACIPNGKILLMDKPTVMVWTSQKMKELRNIMYSRVDPASADFKDDLAIVISLLNMICHKDRMLICQTRQPDKTKTIQWDVFNTFVKAFPHHHMVARTNVVRTFFSDRLNQLSVTNKYVDRLPMHTVKKNFDIPNRGVRRVMSNLAMRELEEKCMCEQWRLLGMPKLEDATSGSIMALSYACATHMKNVDQWRAPFIDGSFATSYDDRPVVYARSSGVDIVEGTDDSAFCKVWNESVDSELNRFTKHK